MANPMLRGAQVAMSGGAAVRSFSAGLIGLGGVGQLGGDAVNAIHSCRRRRNRRENGGISAEHSNLALSIYSNPSNGAPAAAQPAVQQTAGNNQLVYDWKADNTRLQNIIQEQTDSQDALLVLVKGLQEKMAKIERENSDLKSHMETDIQKAKDKIENECHAIMISKMEQLADSKDKEMNLLKLQMANNCQMVVPKRRK